MLANSVESASDVPVNDQQLKERTNPRARASWAMRHGLWLVGCAPVIPQLLGSAFNIYYNRIHVLSLLVGPEMEAHFAKTILFYNLTVYPVIVGIWIWVVDSLRRPIRKTLLHHPIPPEELARARRRAINLPWWAVGLAAVGWLLCIPVFVFSWKHAPGTPDPRVYLHVSVSVMLGALIGLTQALFAVELASQRLLLPILFQGASPAATPGTLPVSLRARGFLWAASAGVCPILALLLLLLIEGSNQSFAITVAVLGIGFGMSSAWMLGRLVAEPVDALRAASQAVTSGDLKVRIDLLRADEFGPLIDEFNTMVAQLREKERIEQTFGRHVGQTAAREILQRNPGLGGVEQEVTIMFADLRNFTSRCSQCSPQQAVSLLNLYFTEMLAVAERHDGMVNQLMGDGFMTIYGAVGEPDHAAAAVMTGLEMLASLKNLNQSLQTSGEAPLAMGIGIHTGPAVIGTIGSPQRMDFTAIGDTVNLASRIESLTKAVGEPLLITEATRNALPSTFRTWELPPQPVKGKDEMVKVHGVEKSPAQGSA
jgi:adenylate cyclase